MRETQVERHAPMLQDAAVMVRKRHLVAPAEFIKLMGWSSEHALWASLEKGHVFFVEHKSARYFPAFLSHRALQRTQLNAINRILYDLAGGSRLQFFLTRKGSLGGCTPLDALAAGQFADVKRGAAAFAERAEDS
jgi:hypothetical protein